MFTWSLCGGVELGVEFLALLSDPVCSLGIAALPEDLGRLERGVTPLRHDLLDSGHAFLDLWRRM